jgi:hypothetical protein
VARTEDGQCQEEGIEAYMGDVLLFLKWRRSQYRKQLCGSGGGTAFQGIKGQHNDHLSQFFLSSNPGGWVQPMFAVESVLCMVLDMHISVVGTCSKSKTGGVVIHSSRVPFDICPLKN